MSIFASGAKEDMVTSRRGEKITRGLKHAAARRDLSSACAWGDDFTVSGFEDSDRNDGCYSVLDYHFDGVFNGVPRFTLDSREKEEKRGLIFTAKDMDQGPDGVSLVLKSQDGVAIVAGAGGGEGALVSRSILRASNTTAFKHMLQPFGTYINGLSLSCDNTPCYLLYHDDDGRVLS